MQATDEESHQRFPFVAPLARFITVTGRRVSFSRPLVNLHVLEHGLWTRDDAGDIGIFARSAGRALSLLGLALLALLGLVLCLFLAGFFFQALIERNRHGIFLGPLERVALRMRQACSRASSEALL